MAGLKEFFEKLASDTALQEKVKTAGDENALLKVIKDAGYNVKPEEWKKFSGETAPEGELSDSELEDVAGGFSKEDLQKCKQTQMLILLYKRYLSDGGDQGVDFIRDSVIAYRKKGLIDEEMLIKEGIYID